MDEELAAMPRHVLDMVPPDVSKVLHDILKYRVDPNGDYYGITEEVLQAAVKNLRKDTVAAIAIEPGETKYKEKGHMYDPILQSFVQGAGGRISSWSKEEQTMIPVVLRGVTKRKEMAAC